MKYLPVIAGALIVASCGSSGDNAADSVAEPAPAESAAETVATTAATEVAESTVVTETETDADVDADAETSATVVAESGTEIPAETDAVDDAAPSGEVVSFTAEVWADNWFALYVNGELVGEDSVPITTERSFNAETITFEASYPLTIAIEAKDFKETDSGIEYIGAGNQQMGDGGLIAQITDTATGEVVAVTDSSWTALAVHRAPLNKDCEKSADPDTECEFEILETPADWASVSYDDSGWASATTWSGADVNPKDGYDQISWNGDAELIWGSDLEIDNTILFRTVTS